LNTRTPGPASINTLDEAPEDQRVVKDPATAGAESDDDDDDDGEFEVMSGQQILDKQKLEQLHKMEVGEAAALKMKMEDDDDDDDDTPTRQKSTS
jgi:hypothetical protein